MASSPSSSHSPLLLLSLLSLLFSSAYGRDLKPPESQTESYGNHTDLFGHETNEYGHRLRLYEHEVENLRRETQLYGRSERLGKDFESETVRKLAIAKTCYTVTGGGAYLRNCTAGGLSCCGGPKGICYPRCGKKRCCAVFDRTKTCCNGVCCLSQNCINNKCRKSRSPPPPLKKP